MKVITAILILCYGCCVDSKY